MTWIRIGDDTTTTPDFRDHNPAKLAEAGPERVIQILAALYNERRPFPSIHLSVVSAFSYPAYQEPKPSGTMVSASGIASISRDPMNKPAVLVSVVSHGQNRLVNQLLGDLARLRPANLGMIVTENIPDSEPLDAHGLRIDVVANATPKGFGANHNAAFERCTAPRFCVVNPDIRLKDNPFPALLAALEREKVAVAGPRVRAPDGAIEDSARRFPTVGRLLRKFLPGRPGPDYAVDRGPLEVDWVAGMFMGFRSDAFRAVNGFDERYFLYYEDVDICRRLKAAGYKTVYQPGVSVVHDARRASRRNPRLMAIHVASALRYLLGRHV